MPGLLLALALWIGGPLADGAIFVRIPGVPGDVKVKGYDDGTWFEARSGSYGAERDLVDFASGTSPVNIGIGELLPLGIVCDLNRAAAPLLQAAFNGNSIGDVDIHLVELGEKPVTFGTIRLTRTFVKDFETETPEDERPWFQAFLYYNQIEVTNRLGGPDGLREQVSTWDLVKLTGSYREGDVVNQPPGIQPIADQTMDEDTSIVLPVTVSDPDTPASSLTTTAASSNQTLVPNSGLVMAGDGANRTLAIDSAPNAFGAATITVVVSDGAASESTDFLLTVNPLPDDPEIEEIDPQVTDLDTALTVPLFPSDPDQSAEGLLLEVRSTDRLLVPDTGLVVEHGDAGWILSITPGAGQSGSAEIQVLVQDETDRQVTTSFILTVNSPGNSAPSEILLEPKLLREDALDGTIIGNLRAIDPDGDSEIIFSLVDDDSGHFVLVDGDRIETGDGARFDYESDPRHLIRVRARDPDGAILEQLVEIEVVNVNEPPVITLELPPSLPNSPPAAPSPVPIRYPDLDISDPDSGAGDVTVEFTVIHGTLHLDDSGVLSGKVLENDASLVAVAVPLEDLRTVLAEGGFSYLPVPGYDGVEQLTVLVDDNGNTGVGGSGQVGAVETFLVSPSQEWDWLHEFFSPEEIDDPDIGGLFTDFDKDRLEGILEFKLARNPRDPGDGGRVIELDEVMVGPDPRWEIGFVQRTDESTPHTRLEVEVSSDSVDWRRGSEVVEMVSRTPLGDDLERVVYRLTRTRIEEPRQLIRLCAIYDGPGQ